MRHKPLAALTALSLIAVSTSAMAEPANITVTGNGQVRTPAELATATFEVRGEGATPDAATTAVAQKIDSVSGAISSLPGAKLTISTGKMTVNAVRGAGCKTDYETGPRLSTGACAISGYVATVPMKAIISPPTEAGTVLGLAARQGVENAELAGFTVRDPAAAEKKALAAALTDARDKALAIAQGSGGHLGPVLSVRDRATRDDFEEIGGLEEITVTAERRRSPPAVAVSLKPEPIETTAQLTVSYSVTY